MSVVLVHADLVGSTGLKDRYHVTMAAKKITDALNRIRDELCQTDNVGGAVQVTLVETGSHSFSTPTGFTAI